MGKIAIIGKQQPRFIREAMVEYIKQQGHDAVLLDTSDLDIDGVVAAIKTIAGEKIPV